MAFIQPVGGVQSGAGFQADQGAAFGHAKVDQRAQNGVGHTAPPCGGQGEHRLYLGVAVLQRDGPDAQRFRRHRALP